MRPGKLRHVVTVERAVEATSTRGAVQTTYVPYLTRIAAHVLPAGEGARGGEQYVNAQVLATIDTKIRIRYRRDITSKMRVRRDIGPGSPTLVELWDILAVTPADARNRETWLWCRRRDTAGFRTGT